MSDTDDTDSLLSVAAPTGLTNFLGLSVDEMSSRIKSLANNSNMFNNNHNNSSGGSGRALTQEDVRQAEFVKNDILSQLAEYSDSDNDDDAKSDTGSEASTASTNSITMLYPSEAKEEDLKSAILLPDSIPSRVETSSSMNYVPVARGSPSPSSIRNYEEEQQREIISTFQKHFPNFDNFQNSNQLVVLEEKYKLPTYGVRVSHGVDFLRQSPHTTGWRYTTAFGNDPQIISRAPNFRTPGGYKPPLNPVPPRDLSDDQVHEEVKRMYAFPDDTIDSDEDNLDKNESTINTSKELSVDHADSHDGAQGGDDNTNDIDSQVIQNVNKLSITEGAEEEVRGTPSRNDNDVIDSAPVVVHEVKESNNNSDGVVGGKVKRKLVSSAGDNIGSIPDLGFGLRDLSKLEVRKNPVVPSQAWFSDIHCGRQTKTQNDNTSSSSAQFRDEHDLEISPIKAAYLENSKNTPDISRCLPRRARQLKKNNVAAPRKVSLLELDLLWKDIQRTKYSMEEEMNKDSANLKAVAASLEPVTTSINENQNNKFQGKVSFQEPSKSSSSEKDFPLQQSSLTSALESLSIDEVGSSKKNTRQQKSILKSKSGVKKSSRGVSRSPRTPSQSNHFSDSISFDMDSTGDDLTMMSMSLYDSSPAALPTDLDTIDFSSILSAAHMKPSEFDDILSRLDDFSDAAIEQMTGADEEIEDVVTKLEVTDWAKSGATEYLQKYYDEKNRRELCESENGILNKVVLKLKEELAVKSKMLNKKDGVLLKMTKAWQDITTRWKIHEKQSKEILLKLQQDHSNLLESSKRNKERIDSYEKELGNAIDVASMFKLKLEALEKANCDNVEKLEEENNLLKEKFCHLESSLTSIKDEKDAAVRALSESQKQLDERSALHDELQERLTFVQLESEEGQKDFMKVVEQKQALEKYLQSVTVQKDSLESEVVHVTEKLKEERAEKERLESMVTKEIQNQVKAEQERLQEYYTMKLQQQAEEAIAKEVVIVNTHQQELMTLEKNLMKILEDCKKSCYAEMDKKQRRYDKEIRGLREELAHKQHFISKMSREFYEQTEAVKETDQSACIDKKKGGGSVVSRQFGNDNIDNSRCSSNDSLIQKTPNARPSNSKFYDDEVSSIDDFNPSKLGKYNISTPTSDLVPLPRTTTITTTTKGWRELPNIQHLLTPLENDSYRVLSMISSATIVPPDKENQHIGTPSNAVTPISRRLQVYDRKSISSTPAQDSTSEQGISEQRIRKCMQTLLKVYSSRLNQDESNNNTKDPSTTQVKSVTRHTAASPLTTSKMTQHKDSHHSHDIVTSCTSHFHPESQTNELNRRNSMSSSYSSKEPGKQSLKPPWK